MLSVAFALLVAWLVPQLTALALRGLLLRGLPAEGEDRRARLFGFRRAAFLVGLVQIQIAWMVGMSSVGPELVASPDAPLSYGAGALAALVAFVSGGVARATIESRSSPPREVALLRLRLAPLFAGPLLAALGARSLPIVDAASRTIHVGWALVALAIVAVGVAYGGLALSLLTFAIRPATPEIRAMARDVATREGTSVGLVLRLPTGGARLANAAAIPWARAMVVTDHIVSLLDPEALRAVLAHEAGHLSEKPIVGLARLSAATLLIYSLTCGIPLASCTPDVSLSPHPFSSSSIPVGVPILIAVIVFGLVSLLLVRRLARRMEERADAHAMATVGGLPLARALRAIGDDAEMPLVTEAKRTHPDLWDRLVALGDDPGPRPTPRNARPAMRAGALVALALVVVYGGALYGASIDGNAAATTSPMRTRLALVVEPWDGGGHLALAWGRRHEGDLGGAAHELRLAAASGIDEGQYDDLRAELLAAQDRCDEARDAIDDAARVRGPTLRLRAESLPPTYVARCVATRP